MCGIAATRGIENQIYAALTGTVGQLLVTGLGLNYGQAGILTPSQFPFSRDGIAAKGVPNTEQIVIADVDLADREESRIKARPFRCSTSDATFMSAPLSKWTPVSR